MFFGLYTVFSNFYRNYRLARIRREYGNKDTIIYTLRHGYQMELHLNDHVAQRLALTGSFEPEVSAIISALIRRGMTVVDIGANVGVHALHFSKQVGEQGQVLAIEPNSTTYSQLKRNVELNKFENVITLECALWETEGSRTFYYPENGMEAFGGLQSNSSFRVARTGQVRTSRLDTVLSRLNLNRVDFIKIDVEGAELPVLKGASSLLTTDVRPVILYESTAQNSAPYGYSPTDLHEFLEDKGYHIEMIDHADYLALP